MKLRNKILLGLLGVVLLLQIPFIVVRWNTGSLSDKIEHLSSTKNGTIDTGFRDYKGVIHAHSFLGGHSTGTFEKLLDGAKQAELDFVVMTEHVSDNFDTSAMTLRAKHGGVLFIGGNETSVNDGNRFLVLDGFSSLNKANKLNTDEFLDRVHDKSRLAFVTYPEKFSAWDAPIDGIEVFSLHTNAKSMNPFSIIFDGIWSYGSYPELTLARYFKRPNKNLLKFDELSKTKSLTLFAGTDAHSNLGFHIGDDSNNKWLNFKLDRYGTIFKLVKTHVVLQNDQPLTKASLLSALKAGNVFIGVDVLSDSTGFLFTAESDTEKKIIGDEILLEKGSIELKAAAPQISRFVIYRNGKQIYESGQTLQITFKAKEKGAYRVEVYLDTLGNPFDKMPWVISNPIYIK